MNFVLLVPYIFLLFWAVKILFAGILRLTSPELGLMKDYTLTPSVVVLVSCYNEGPTIYQTLEAAGKSNYPVDRLKILAFDDCSRDDSWDWMQKAARDFPSVVVMRNATNQGKAKTIVAAIENSASEIIITIDSDTILEVNAIRELTACFSDPKLALVGGLVKLSNPNENALTVFQTYIYALGFHFLKLPESYFRQVAVISGCMSAIRRSVFEEIKPDIEKRNFLGVPVRYGEDRFITHQTLLHGHRTFFTPKAICWTTAPNTYESYWGQQIRWVRGALGDFLRTMRHLYSNTSVGLVALFNYFFVPVMSLLGVVMLFILLLFASPLETVVTKFIYYILGLVVLGFLVNICIQGQRAKKNLLYVVVYGAWGILRSLLLIPAALFTLDSDGWGGARNKNDEKGSQ